MLALERAAPTLVDEGVLDGALVSEALAQARDPEFRVLGPLTISAWGRRPGGVRTGGLTSVDVPRCGNARRRCENGA